MKGISSDREKMTNRNVKCPKCGKYFQEQEALDKHYIAKHIISANVAHLFYQIKIVILNL